VAEVVAEEAAEVVVQLLKLHPQEGPLVVLLSRSRPKKHKVVLKVKKVYRLLLPVRCQK
jgi:hypothetical protein